VPHGKFAALKGVMAVFMKVTPRSTSNPSTNQPVDIVDDAVGPDGAGADHLKALARVARVLRTRFRGRCTAPDHRPGRIYTILTSRWPRRRRPDTARLPKRR